MHSPKTAVLRLVNFDGQFTLEIAWMGDKPPAPCPIASVELVKEIPLCQTQAGWTAADDAQLAHLLGLLGRDSITFLKRLVAATWNASIQSGIQPGIKVS